MYPSATIERRIPKRLLFGAAVVALSSARLTPSSVLASASKRATSRIAERANEPSATAALSSARRELVARRTGWFLKGAIPSPRGSTVESITPPLQLAGGTTPAQSRQTPGIAAARVRHPMQEETMATTLETETRPETHQGVRIEDVEYQRQRGRALVARLYRPVGAGPYPAVVQVHGGAWVNKDRTDNDFIARAFAESGILVASLDFRMPPEAPYPA